MFKWNSSQTNQTSVEGISVLQSVRPSEVTQATPGKSFILEVKKPTPVHLRDFFFSFAVIWLKIAKDLPQHIFSMSQGLWEKLWLSKINPWAENLKEPLNSSKLVVCLDLLLFKSNFVWTFSFKCDTVYTTDCRGAGAEVTNIITTHFRKMLAAKTSSSL